MIEHVHPTNYRSTLNDIYARGEVLIRAEWAGDLIRMESGTRDERERERERHAEQGRAKVQR